MVCATPFCKPLKKKTNPHKSPVSPRVPSLEKMMLKYFTLLYSVQSLINYSEVQITYLISITQS